MLNALEMWGGERAPRTVWSTMDARPQETDNTLQSRCSYYQWMALSHPGMLIRHFHKVQVYLQFMKDFDLIKLEYLIGDLRSHQVCCTLADQVSWFCVVLNHNELPFRSDDMHNDLLAWLCGCLNHDQRLWYCVF